MKSTIRLNDGHKHNRMQIVRLCSKIMVFDYVKNCERKESRRGQRKIGRFLGLTFPLSSSMPTGLSAPPPVRAIPATTPFLFFIGLLVIQTISYYHSGGETTTATIVVTGAILWQAGGNRNEWSIEIHSQNNHMSRVAIEGKTSFKSSKTQHKRLTIS